MDKPGVLFLCTGNSARSQMAEGFLRGLAGDRFVAASAGTDPQGLNPLAVRAMQEMHIDISNQRSKSISEFLDKPFEYVITVCDSARQACPVFSGGQRILHWDIEDPAKAQGSEEERLAKFRRARDEIRQRILSFLLENDKP